MVKIHRDDDRHCFPETLKHIQTKRLWNSDRYFVYPGSSMRLIPIHAQFLR